MMVYLQQGGEWTLWGIWDPVLQAYIGAWIEDSDSWLHG